MTDRLILLDLVAAVQCKGNHVDKERWETIAAFDLYVVAEQYAETCRAARPAFEYRVVKLGGANQMTGESRMRAGASGKSSKESL